ncbi:MAG TPA: electron transfer flavoprotein subunit alpha/FixB family protein [Methylovirgula sp.]|nr:electron transfer flavoprotein subunit alpha/FixB family protein [Methylovirgula sp.]
MAVLLVAEHQNGRLNDATHKAVAAAAQIGGPIHILVAGHDVTACAEAAARLAGVEKVLVADDPLYAHQLAEPVAALIVALAGSYTALVAPATASGKNVMPRVAALLDVMQISDITKVLAPDIFERPIYAGNAIERVQSAEAKKVVTVRTAAFQPVGETGNAVIEKLAPGPDPKLSRFVSETLSASDRPELCSARVVISGGRGLQATENFTALIAPVADALGAAIGASRAAVDAGYAPNDWQIGQTGKVVAPDLYIAVGISGAVQHLAGMKDSKVIVAINKDEAAPIFQVADYGIVGDLFTILPALKEELAKSR